jgi:hypothetical protein
MIRKSALFAAIALIAFTGAAGAQTPAPVTPSTSLAPPPDAPPPHPTAPGPYAVAIESDPALATHTIYRPADLAPFTGANRLPIIAWGNGACSNAGLLFETFLTEIASHGYVIIVSGPKDAPLPAFARGGAARPPAPPAPGAAPPAPGPLPPMTKDQDMQTALNWAVAEADRQGSAYYHHLDPDKIAVMGQSCGGLQAIANSGDPRVKTTMVWNSGTFPDGAMPMALSGASKQSLAKFHAPVAYIDGGPADLAHGNSTDDVSRIQNVPVFHGWINVGHGGAYNQPGGGWFGAVGVAWLDWRLKGDQQAAKMFAGPDCTLCTDPVWHVEKKNME